MVSFRGKICLSHGQIGLLQGIQFKISDEHPVCSTRDSPPAGNVPFCSIPSGVENPWGGLLYGTDGDACLKETIWAWLKLFVIPKVDQSGCGLGKF